MKKNPSQSQTQSTNFLRTEMTYIILYDTFGSGLKPFTSLGLEVYNKDQLREAVVAAAQELLEAESCETMEEYDNMYAFITISNTIVICEIVEKVGDISVENYIKEVVKQKEGTERKGRYKVHLKIKDTIVICEIVEKVGCMSVENYINEVVKQKEDTERKE